MISLSLCFLISQAGMPPASRPGYGEDELRLIMVSTTVSDTLAMCPSRALISHLCDLPVNWIEERNWEDCLMASLKPPLWLT